MPDLLGQIKRKAAHRKKEKQKLTYHVVVYSVVGAPRSITNAAFTIERGDHAFESTTATQTDGSFFWNERISQQVTLYRNEDGSFEEKEYTLKLWAMTPGPKGVDKRGDVFGRAKLNLAKYSGATTGKRVVLTLAPEGAAAAQDKGRNITVVVTVAAESEHSGTELAALDATSAADKALAAKFDDSDDEGDAPGGGAPAAFGHGGGSSDEEDSEPPTPQKVAPAAGVKPLPPPPPPTQLVAKAVEWHGVGAGTVRETQRLFALCCPCLQKSDQFQPLQ